MRLEPRLSAGTPKVNGDGIWKRLLDQWQLQVMVIPGILLLLVFHYLPMWGLLTSFQNYNLTKGFFGSEWIGLKHFRMFFESGDFYVVMKHTLAISLLKLVLGFPAPILLALMLNEARHRTFKRTIQTITYLPHFMSWVIVAGMVISILSVDNGSLNMLLMSLHVIGEPVNWLSIAE